MSSICCSVDPFSLLARQSCAIICFRANEKKELETKQHSATAADPHIAAAAAAGAAASSAGQTELHELKRRNDELEDEVS